MTKTFGPKATRLIKGSSRQIQIHVVVAKYNIYNIITCYVRWNKSTPCAAKEEKKHGKDIQQAAAGDDDKDKK